MAYVLGDVILKQVALDEDAMRSLVSRRGPNKYTNYVPMVPGDYTYQNAYLALKVYAPVGVGRPAIGNCALSVDLPDIQEQIIGSVPASGWATFTLTKRFSVAPEIIVYQRNGTALASGLVRNITKTSFEAALVNASGFIAGDISAIASGY